MQRGFEVVSKEHLKNEGVTLLPLRGTKTSAGYDFYTPVDLAIVPQEKVLFWTDVKAKMSGDEVLLIDVRSSLGIKSDLMMANTIGVIDSDYHNNPSNDGNVGICLRNLKPDMELQGYQVLELMDRAGEITEVIIPMIRDLSEDNTVYIEAGERVAQGIFVKYLESENCNTKEDRAGGIGSTAK